MSNEIVISVSGNTTNNVNTNSSKKKKSSSSNNNNNNNNKNSTDTISSIHVWDATTGGKLMNFKGCSGASNGLSLVLLRIKIHPMDMIFFLYHNPIEKLLMYGHGVVHNHILNVPCRKLLDRYASPNLVYFVLVDRSLVEFLFGI